MFRCVVVYPTPTEPAIYPTPTREKPYLTPTTEKLYPTPTQPVTYPTPTTEKTYPGHRCRHKAQRIDYENRDIDFSLRVDQQTGMKVRLLRCSSTLCLKTSHFVIFIFLRNIN